MPRGTSTECMQETSEGDAMTHASGESLQSARFFVGERTGVIRIVIFSLSEEKFPVVSWSFFFSAEAKKILTVFESAGASCTAPPTLAMERVFVGASL